MLTKDLLKFRRRADRVLPVFLDPADSKVRGTAASLCDIAAAGVGETCGRVEEDTADAAHGAPYGAGLRKLVLERLEVAPEAAEVEDRRWRALTAAEDLRRRADDVEPPDFRAGVADAVGVAADELARDLYCDLPASRNVQGMKPTDPEWLVHRYNLAQVQGLLLRSRLVVVTVKNATLSQKRALFRQLKFHRLMCEVQPDPGEKTMRFSLSGPLGIFQNAQTYGIRLANFFPALVHLPEWQVEAQCKVDGRALVLKVDHKIGLRSHYRQREGHVPAELTACLTSFMEQNPGWKGREGGEFVPVGRQSYCFPDITLEHADGRIIHVELFHRWHAGQLGGRLKALDANPVEQLAVGVCRSLAKKPEVAEWLASSREFAKRGFLFRDLPSPRALGDLVAKLPLPQLDL